MKTMATKEKQEKQLQEAIGKVNTWKNKFHFSFATLLFVSFLLITYSLNSFLASSSRKNEVTATIGIIFL
jgi:hypothetical protein